MRVPCSAADALHVGDDLALDVAGAIGAGWKALLLTRDEKEHTGTSHKSPFVMGGKTVYSIANLADLVRHI